MCVFICLECVCLCVYYICLRTGKLTLLRVCMRELIFVDISLFESACMSVHLYRFAAVLCSFVPPNIALADPITNARAYISAVENINAGCAGASLFMEKR